VLEKLVARLTASVRGVLRRRTHQPGEVRLRRAGDLSRCIRLVRMTSAGGRHALPPSGSPRAWLEDPALLDAWVADRDGVLLGHVALARVGGDPTAALRWREVTGRPPAQLAEISRLVVRPGARAAEVVQELVGAALTGARERGLHPVLQTLGATQDEIRAYEELGGRLQAMYPSDGRTERRELLVYVWPAATAASAPDRVAQRAR
jgi:GNAT superfamily N-acetyltransferase